MTAIFEFKENFPVGNPDQAVPETILANVRVDYIEALRCRSVSAFKATVAMCRRALQSSCRGLKAQAGRLLDEIDELQKRGIITTALQGMAHDIRKLGTEGAHPDEDGLGDVIKEDADNILEFARQYFEHVYVMPAKSEAFRRRREAASPTSTAPKPATG